jgi:Tfp pilus assembly protein FimV
MTKTFRFIMTQRLVVACALLAASSLALAAAEPQPGDNTRLSFRRTLLVHQSPGAKIFAETHKIQAGDTLWKILTQQYDVSRSALPTLVEAFREVNPGIDPNVLQIGQVVRVPFKVESSGFNPEPLTPPVADDNYVVRPGDTLWKILGRDYGIAKSERGRMLKKVAKANPGIPDLNRLWVGQLLIIPAVPVNRKTPQQPVDPENAAKIQKPGVPPYFVSVLELIEALGCRVDREGQTFIPVDRGRTVRLSATEFPLITGPSGKKKVILDPGKRLSAALVRAMEKSWGYRTVQGTQLDAEQFLAELLPNLGFQEASQGSRPIGLEKGAVLMAHALWTVIASTEDLWENRIHLIFPVGARIDPRLGKLCRDKGFVLHRLATAVEDSATARAKDAAVKTLSASDPVAAAAQFFELMQIPHRVAPEISHKLKSGVSYRITPRLTFSHGGLDYAVPPPTPSRAEAVLLRAGYFTFTWIESSTAPAKLTDLLALTSTSFKERELDVPDGEALRLQLGGIEIASDKLLDGLYPGTDEGRVFVTEAPLDAAMAGVLIEAGYYPWVFK